MSKIDDVARGLLIDAFITYAAICREKGYDQTALSVWSLECERLAFRTNGTGFGKSDYTADAVMFSILGDASKDEHVETLIEERRGLIRDTMREEMANLEAASSSPEDAEGIRDERQG